MFLLLLQKYARIASLNGRVISVGVALILINSYLFTFF